MSIVVLSLMIVAQAAEKEAVPPPPVPVKLELPKGFYAPQAGDTAFLFPQGTGTANSAPIIQPEEKYYKLFMKQSQIQPPSAAEGALEKMIEEKRLLLVKAGTKVKVEKPIASLVEKGLYAVEITIADGPLKGVKAYTPFTWLVQQEPKTADGRSVLRQQELEEMVQKRQRQRMAKRSRIAAIRRQQDIDDARNQAAAAAAARETIRRNTPDYMSVTTDARGQISSIYARMPDGSTSFRTSDGYQSNTRVFGK